MFGSNFNNALANQLQGVVIAPKEQKEWTWTGLGASPSPTARTTSSVLARAVIVGEKETGHPEGLVDAQETAHLLMMDIMEGLK
jgi:hypothetical protein